MCNLRAAPKVQSKLILKSLTDKPINSDLGFESIVFEKDQDALIQIGPFSSSDELLLWSRPGNLCEIQACVSFPLSDQQPSPSLARCCGEWR